MHSLQLIVPDKVEVRDVFIVEEVDEDEVVSQEAAGDHWVLKVVYWHRMIVQVDQVVEAYLVSQGLYVAPRSVAEDSHLEETIV